MLLGALVNAATFASFTFLAPVVTGTAGLSELWISVALVLFGIGSFAGVTVAGRLSDQHPGPVIAVGGPLLLVGWPALAVLADKPVALLALVFIQGALSFALGSTLITRVLYEAPPPPDDRPRPPSRNDRPLRHLGPDHRHCRPTHHGLNTSPRPRAAMPRRTVRHPHTQ
jgi:predicted MFS family arabinose efflux permease